MYDILRISLEYYVYIRDIRDEFQNICRIYDMNAKCDILCAISSEYPQNIQNVRSPLYIAYDILSIFSECYVYIWEIPYEFRIYGEYHVLLGMFYTILCYYNVIIIFYAYYILCFNNILYYITLWPCAQ